MPPDTQSARCQRFNLEHDVIAIPYATLPGRKPKVAMSCKSPRQQSQLPAFSHTEIAALSVIGLRCTPCACISPRSPSARCEGPTSRSLRSSALTTDSHAEIAAPKLTALASSSRIGNSESRCNARRHCRLSPCDEMAAPTLTMVGTSTANNINALAQSHPRPHAEIAVFMLTTPGCSPQEAASSSKAEARRQSRPRSQAEESALQAIKFSSTSLERAPAKSSNAVSHVC
mmetsp:Transcript_106953/g.300775  ORF Transcript_106953/g.300775 Transcript_106953/m.300775 type:complete len:230 (+) Transcript_106953:182-871(+)